MDLWIRSQDKKLLEKVSGVTLDNEGIEIYSTKTGRIFGIYETKERALEVLNEIQNLLIPKINVNTFNIKNEDMLNGRQFLICENAIKDSSIKQYETYVYEMPEK